MKYILPLLLILTPFLSHAQQTGQTGVGLVIGNPTGVAGKYWLNENHAIDGAVAISVGKHTNFSLHSDYLFHDKDAFFFNDDVPLDLYYGLGARMEFDDAIEFGARVPVGLAHKFENERADMFAEIAPILDFVSKTGLELSFGIGARYYFR